MLSPNQNLQMWLSKLRKEIKICILNSRLTALEGRAAGRGGDGSKQPHFFPHLQLEAQPLAVGGEGVHRGVFRTAALVLGTTVLARNCHWDISVSHAADFKGQGEPSEAFMLLLLHLPGRGMGVQVNSCCRQGQRSFQKAAW